MTRSLSWNSCGTFKGWLRGKMRDCVVGELAFADENKLNLQLPNPTPEGGTDEDTVSSSFWAEKSQFFSICPPQSNV